MCSFRLMQTSNQNDFNNRRTDYAHHMSVLYNLTYVANDYFVEAAKFFKRKFQVGFSYLDMMSP